jgi:L-asparaginase II
LEDERPVAVTEVPRGGRRGRPAARSARPGPAPILVRHRRNAVDELVDRGDVVEVDQSGRIIRAIGDPARLTTLRSAVKPFGLLALLEAGGDREFQLEPAELAIMTSSHSGEDLHVRTLQALFRRTGISQSDLGCGTMTPLDALTAARLARDGERPGVIRHMCSGQHSVFLLLSRLGGWSPAEYWADDHPTQVALRDVVAKAFRTTSKHLVLAIDTCGIATFAFPLQEIAWAFACLADPESIPGDDPRSKLAPHYLKIRAAMLAHPEMVAGTHDRFDTSLMKAAPDRIVAKGGGDHLRAAGVLPGPRASGRPGPASGMALTIESGDPTNRATPPAFVEALRQAGVLDGQALRVLGLYHRPTAMDSHGRVAVEAIPDFELAPVGELIG